MPVEDRNRFLQRLAALVPALQLEADDETGFPDRSLQSLREMGVMAAPLPFAAGGLGLGAVEEGASTALFLRLLGRGSVALGRLIEGHVNALRLVWLYGDEGVRAAAAADARAGHLFGIWVTEMERPLRIGADGVLEGGKNYCSGAGRVTRPLVTAAPGEGPPVMVLARLTGEERVGTARTMSGVKGARTADMELSGVSGTVVGAAGDYLRQPEFSAGAWRGSAVALGALEALVEMAVAQLRGRGRHTNPHQAARIGRMLIAAETARLWVERACEGDGIEDAERAALVNLARIAVETACLDALVLVQRSLGLAAFVAGPVERMGRDLATYLRQPAPDETLTEAALWVCGARYIGGAVMRAADAQAAMRRFPVAAIDVVCPGTVLVLAPHPDDESIGCGGVIARLCDAGRPPVVVVATDGAFSHPGSRAFPPERLRVVREAEAREAVRILGVPDERVRFLGLADGAAPVAGAGFEAAVGEVEAVVRRFGCSVVLAPWLRDPHCDHEAVQLMARAVVDRSPGLRLLSYPVWGWLLDGDTELAGEPKPAGWRVEVASVLGRKRRAIAAHRSQTGSLIVDDPDGFSLPDALMEACVTAHEFFIEDRR